MYFLASNICEMTEINVIWDIVGWVIKAIWFGIPIVLIILGMIDLGTAVIASKEDEVKKATKAFGKRFMYAVLVFLVVWIVQLVLTFVSSFGFGDNMGDTKGWQACWCKINKGSEYTYKNTGTDAAPKYECTK